MKDIRVIEAVIILFHIKDQPIVGVNVQVLVGLGGYHSTGHTIYDCVPMSSKIIRRIKLEKLDDKTDI